MKITGLEAVYYPRSYVSDRRSLASYCLFFEKVHLMHLGDVSAKGKAVDPTSYMKGLPNKIQISRLGKPGGDELAEEYAEHFRFAVDNRDLLGEVIFYHPHLHAQEIERITSTLLSGKGLALEDQLGLFSGQSDEARAFREFREAHPEIANELTLRVVPSAVFLSKKHDWCLIGDDPSMPVPELSRVSSSVRQMTAILADECIRIALPRCEEIRPAELLQARETLSDLLVPFRMSMQRLTKELRAVLGHSAQLPDVWREARFLAESEVQPAVHDLIRRVQKDKDKLLSKVFGKAISWIPFLAKAYAMPSADSIYRAMEKVYDDVGSMVQETPDPAFAREPGLSFLLGVNEQLGKVADR